MPFERCNCDPPEKHQKLLAERYGNRDRGDKIESSLLEILFCDRSGQILVNFHPCITNLLFRIFRLGFFIVYELGLSSKRDISASLTWETWEGKRGKHERGSDKKEERKTASRLLTRRATRRIRLRSIGPLYEILYAHSGQILCNDSSLNSCRGVNSWFYYTLDEPSWKKTDNGFELTKFFSEPLRNDTVKSF